MQKRQLRCERSCIITLSPCLLRSLHASDFHEDPARWDESARSWLRSADRAKVAQRNPLNVITRSLPLRLAVASSTMRV